MTTAVEIEDYRLIEAGPVFSQGEGKISYLPALAAGFVMNRCFEKGRKMISACFYVHDRRYPGSSLALLPDFDVEIILSKAANCQLFLL